MAPGADIEGNYARLRGSKLYRLRDVIRISVLSRLNRLYRSSKENKLLRPAGLKGSLPVLLDHGTSR